MKPLRFVGGTREELSGFPRRVRTRCGFQLFMLQIGRQPDDWKPMPSVGLGAREIRVRDAAGAFRVVYVARFADAVYVLHAFQKKSEKTARDDLDLAQRRYREARALAKESSR
jgi:phage-related protein